MPIWGSRMTDLARRYHVGIASVLRRCALTFFCTVPVAAQADAWDEFVDRCLDPYEHLAFEIVTGLEAQPIDQMHDARRVYGPTDEGYLLVLDAAPSLGERACSIEFAGVEDSQAAHDWMVEQVASGRYALGDDGWLVSQDWIEPRLMVRAEASKARTYYAVVETDLES